MKTLVRSRGFGRSCLLGTVAGFLFIAASVTTVAAAVPTLLDTSRSNAGVYFGSFSGGAGSFAIHVRGDNTGVFLGYLPGSTAAITNLNLTVNSAGQFSFSQGAMTALIATEGQPTRVAALAAVSVNGTLGADTSVTGSVVGGINASLSGSRSSDTGATQALAGFYEAGAGNSSGTSLTIASAAGQAFVLAQSGAVLDGGVGTVSASGQVQVATGRSTVVQTIATSNGTVSGTSTGALNASFNGGSEVAVARQRLANFSTRARVAPGDSVAISGFVISGEESKQVLVRAIGPTLGSFGVAGPLAAPRLELYGGSVLFATNVGVATSPRAAAIAAAAAQVGAFALGATSTDSAILATLAPGAYTAQVSGPGTATGIALVEVYDLSPVAAGQKLLNLSGRAIAASGDGTMIAGFVIPPGAAKRVLIRGIGPGLAPFGVQGVLASPTLTLRQGSSMLVRSNRWMLSADAAAVAAASAQVGAFGMAAADAAVIATLAPGGYTAEIVGAGSDPGVALIEVYELPLANWNFGDLTRLKTLSPLPAVPPDKTNAYADDPAAAALGQKFFWDRGYSGPLGQIGVDGHLGNLGESGKVSCASCHMPQSAFIDTRSTPNAISSGAISFQTRNTPTLINNAFFTWYNWTGNRDTIWVAGTAPGSSNGSLLTVAHRVYDAYRAEYDAVFTPRLPAALDARAPDAARFPRPTVNAAGVMQGNAGDATWNQMTAADQEAVLTIVANFAKAMGAYERLLVSRDAPFDRFIAGDANAISDVAKQGAALFVGKGRCIACHSGPLFSDNQFHNLGEPPVTDTGRFGAIPGLRAGNNVFNGGGRFSDDPSGGAAKVAALVQDPSQTGAIRTPTLRHVAQTAPYLRTGRLTTLEQVIDFYNVGGGTSNPTTKSPLITPLGLNVAERAALVAFLQTLTGQPLPAALTRDTSAAP